jgi:hypothetical protein
MGTKMKRRIFLGVVGQTAIAFIFTLFPRFAFARANQKNSYESGYGYGGYGHSPHSHMDHVNCEHEVPTTVPIEQFEKLNNYIDNKRR